MPGVGDIIELIVDIPNKNLHVGVQGTIVHCHADRAYEVEFTNEEGETLDILALRPEQFIVVWRVETRQWVPIAEQAAALVANLPTEAGQEVVDFARFLSTQLQRTGGRHRVADRA